MEHGSNLIERIKADFKAFEFGLIRFYPLYPLFPRSIKVLFCSGSSWPGDSQKRTYPPLKSVFYAHIGTFIVGNRLSLTKRPRFRI